MVNIPRGWRITAWGIYLVIAFSMTHTRAGEIDNLQDFLSDYILHAIGYCILGVLSVWVVLTQHGGLTPRRFLAVYLAILIYATIDERTQPWVGRACELTDWLADAFGALIGMMIAVWLNRALSARRASPGK